VNLGVRLLAAAIFSSIIASGAYGLTADVGRALVASNVLRLSSDAELSGSGAIKAFIVPYAGVVRMRLQLRSDGIDTALAEITSRPGSCSKSTTSASYQTFTCNLRVVAGDRVQAQIFGDAVTIRNVRVFYNVVDSSGVGKILMD
jgi:hypothetical protein